MKNINKIIKESYLFKRTACSRPPSTLPSLWFMTDRKKLTNPTSVALSLPKGAGVVLRDYDMPDRFVLAQKLSKICKERGLIFLVGKDLDLAFKVSANGVHFPEYFLNNLKPSVVSPNWLFTFASHGISSLKKGVILGADAAFLSPAFPTSTHPDRPHLGPLGLARLANSVDIPIIALGGITSDIACNLRGTGIEGISGISLFK